MLLEELLGVAPPELVVQVEVKSYGDPALARATAAAVCRVVSRPVDRDRVEVISFGVAACEEAGRAGLRAAWSRGRTTRPTRSRGGPAGRASAGSASSTSSSTRSSSTACRRRG